MGLLHGDRSTAGFRVTPEHDAHDHRAPGGRPTPACASNARTRVLQEALDRAANTKTSRHSRSDAAQAPPLDPSNTQAERAKLTLHVPQQLPHRACIAPPAPTPEFSRNRSYDRADCSARELLQ